jgi:hypothetical protein
MFFHACGRMVKLQLYCTVMSFFVFGMLLFVCVGYCCLSHPILPDDCNFYTSQCILCIMQIKDPDFSEYVHENIVSRQKASIRNLLKPKRSQQNSLKLRITWFLDFFQHPVF